MDGFCITQQDKDDRNLSQVYTTDPGSADPGPALAGFSPHESLM